MPMTLIILEDIKIADFLTSVTIVVSLIVFLRSLSKDRKIKLKENADKIRFAASKTLAKIDRWQELSICFFQNMKH